MSTTAQKPATTPIPVQLSAPEFEVFILPHLSIGFTFDLTRAQRACGQAIPLGFTPPARAGQGKALQDRFVGIEQDDLAPAGLVLERSEFKRGIGESSRIGRQSAGGAIEAPRIFFNTRRMLSRPS